VNRIIIQGVRRGNVNILLGHTIGHSMQKMYIYIYMCVCVWGGGPIPDDFRDRCTMLLERM
jgi:hypothetical protein